MNLCGKIEFFFISTGNLFPLPHPPPQFALNTRKKWDPDFGVKKDL
jgi:hypothetical protein